MLSKNLLKSSSLMGSTYLNKMVTAAAAPAREFSIAFNVRSKFEAAYQKKQQSTSQAAKKE